MMDMPLDPNAEPSEEDIEAEGQDFMSAMSSLMG